MSSIPLSDRDLERSRSGLVSIAAQARENDEFDREVEKEDKDAFKPEKQRQPSTHAYNDEAAFAKSGFDSELLAAHWEVKWGPVGKIMAFLVRHGCEARGIQPVDAEVRIESLRRRSPIDHSSRCREQNSFVLQPADISSSFRPLPSFLFTFSFSQDRATLTLWSYLPQATLWAAANTNMLTVSAGMLGPELFALPLKTCVGVIAGFNVIAVAPVAYL